MLSNRLRDLEVAEKYLMDSRGDLEEGDAEQLPYPDGHFDGQSVLSYEKCLVL